MSSEKAVTNKSDGLLDPEVAFDLLSSSRRIHTLLALDSEGAMSVSDLADEVTIREYGSTYTEDQRKRIYISLYQAHLPKLESHGVIVWDEGNGEAWLTHTAEQLLSHISTQQERRSILGKFLS